MTAAIILTACWLGLCLWSWWRAQKAVAWLLAAAHRLKNGPSASSSKRLFVLLPCLDEQSLVDETLSHFSCVRRYFPNSTVVAITGESEATRRAAAENTQNDYTWDVVDRWSAAHPAAGILRLHEPATRGTKATKLQFAWTELKLLHGDEAMRGAWLAVYDFDSRPPPETFGALAEELEHPRVEVVQQVPHVLGAELDDYAPASASHAQAIAHYERTLAIETGLRVAQAHRPTWEVRYAMGAGLFIKGSALERAEGFPAYSDDIALGYRLDLMGVCRSIIPVPNFVQPAPSFGAIVRQYRRIYLGIFSVVRELRWFRARRSVLVAGLMLRVLLSNLRSFSNSIRFALALAAVALAAGSSGAAAAAAIALAYFAGECGLAATYAGMAGAIRTTWTPHRAIASTWRSRPVVAAFLGFFPLAMIFDYTLHRAFRMRDMYELAGDKTPRRT